MDNNKKPWYIWLSFLAQPLLFSETRCRYFLLEHWKKDFSKTLDMCFFYSCHMLFLALISALPVGVLALINWYIAKTLQIDGLDGWLNIPCLYFVGVNSSWQHVKWRRKHGLDINKKEKER